MEGGVLKDPKAPWKDAKMTSQMKLKNEFECTLVVTGVIPHKKHPEWVGSLESASAHTQLDIQQGTPIIKTNVGSGLNEDKDSELCRTNGFDRWLGAIIEVKAECISKHNALQHPRITGIRYDKTAADTYDEVVAAYSDSIAIKENIMH
jgi:ATP-dependent DNA ligase